MWESAEETQFFSVVSLTRREMQAIGNGSQDFFLNGRQSNASYRAIMVGY